MADYLILESTDDLFERANAQAEKVKLPEYRQTIKLYYIARYLVSLFEATGGNLPVQVLNEYRNAFDHFARYLAESGDMEKDDGHRNLDKMAGHIQRAVLDICKILCIHFRDFYEEKISPNTGYLRLVTNGDFLREANDRLSKAESRLLEAKVIDSGLGEEVNTNEGVIRAYCDAVFLFKGIEDLHRKNDSHIIEAQNEFSSIHNRGANLSRRQQIGIAAVSMILGYVFSIIT